MMKIWDEKGHFARVTSDRGGHTSQSDEIIPVREVFGETDNS